MGGLNWFETGLKLLGPVMVRSIKYNRSIRLQVAVQKKMNQLEPLLSGLI